VSERDRYERHYQAALRALETGDHAEAQVHGTLAQAAAAAGVTAAIDRLPMGDL
jgi:hypothetical protein